MNMVKKPVAKSKAKAKKPASRKTAKKASPKTETIKVKGEQLLSTVKKTIKEGNVRRITIKDKNGKTLVVLPLTIGVVGAVFAPVLAEVGAIAALVTECSITVERK